MIKTLPLLALLSSSLSAASIQYLIDVNTSSLAGSSGNLYLAFVNGAGTADAATAVISNNGSAGTFAGSATTTGNVTGILLSPVTMVNSAGLNDYLHGLTFGSIIRLLVALNGAAIDTPSGGATAGTTLTVAFDDGANALFTSDPSGAVATIDVGPGGAVVAHSLASGTTVTAVPEPAPFLLGAAALALAAFMRR